MKSKKLPTIRCFGILIFILGIVLILCLSNNIIVGKSLAVTDKLPIDKMDEFVLEFSTHLPILVMQTSVELLRNRTEPPGTAIWYFDNGTENRLTDTATEVYSYATANHRGNSSYFWSNPGFSLCFYDNNYLTQLEVSFFGLESASEWVLRTTYADKSLLRDWFSYELAATILDWQPKGDMVQVFQQDGKYGMIEYLGVFFLCQYIPAYAQTGLHLGEFSLSNTNNIDLNGGGYIFQRNWVSRRNRTVDDFQIMYPPAIMLTSQQDYYLRNEIDFYGRLLKKQGAYHETEYDCAYWQYMDIDSGVDTFLIGETLKTIDRGYRSMYMFRRVGEKLTFGPAWDFDLAMGIGHGAFEFSQGWDSIYIYNDTDIYFNLLECKVFTALLVERYYEYRSSIWTDEKLLELFDSMAEHLEVPAAQSGIDFWSSEVENVREWLINRLHWLDENIPRLIDETPQEINDTVINTHLISITDN